MKHAAGKPVLITDAERSQDDQLRTREIRYAVMMGVRVLCLIAGALLAYYRVPLWGLWSSLCVVGMVLLPWMAVIIANDRPPRAEHQLRNHLHHHDSDTDTASATLPSGAVTVDADTDLAETDLPDTEVSGAEVAKTATVDDQH